MTDPDTPAMPALTPVRTLVRSALEAAVAQAIAAGSLPPEAAGPSASPIEVERPADQRHGDLASNLALKLARPCRMAPLAIAAVIREQLEESMATDPETQIAAVDVAPPGFLNLRLADPALERTIDGILRTPGEWGRVVTQPRSVNVEFVSANPTGPLHIGNARGAFIGDLLARVLEAGGQQVTREYYFNDAGAQISNLGASVAAILRGESPPEEDGYHGQYVHDLARDVPEGVRRAARAPGADEADVLGRWAAGRVREGIEASLARLGVHFDVWTSEGRLHAEGWVQRAVDRLRERGHVYEQDGAVWFRSTDFGDDKDRVIFRSNGEPTYFAADIGYVTEKFARGFDQLIYIWGADHHGTVARVRNAAKAMGYDVDRVQILLYSWVRFVRDGVEVSMSKRAGDFITLDDLLEEVGVDAARWFFASRGATSAIDFDIERMRQVKELVERRRERQSAPDGDEKGVDLGVYYVQYAHARIASILRKAAEAGLTPVTSLQGGLVEEPEANLARSIVRFPEVIEDAVAAEETIGITAYATELATAFTAFYRDARVIDPSELERSARRLALADATRVTLANALGLLGISAPDTM